MSLDLFTYDNIVGTREELNAGARREIERMMIPVSEPLVLPDDSDTRKDLPLTSGVLDYFPNALAAVAEVSKVGNDKHNPGQPLHWSRGKSTDHADCIVRHLIDRGKKDGQGIRHSAYVAWRALANLEQELEDAGATPGRGSVFPDDDDNQPGIPEDPYPYITQVKGKHWLVIANRPPKDGERYISTLDGRGAAVVVRSILNHEVVSRDIVVEPPFPERS